MYLSPVKCAERVSRKILNVKICIWRLFCGTWYFIAKFPTFSIIRSYLGGLEDFYAN